MPLEIRFNIRRLLDNSASVSCKFPRALSKVSLCTPKSFMMLPPISSVSWATSVDLCKLKKGVFNYYFLRNPQLFSLWLQLRICESIKIRWHIDIAYLLFSDKFALNACVIEFLCSHIIFREINLRMLRNLVTL